MRHLFYALLLATTALSACATPAESTSGLDLSGTYACTGTDSHDGDFKATMTLKRDTKHTMGEHVAYVFQMKDEHNTVYNGSAASEGLVIAITFANTDASKKDFGTALGVAFPDRNGGFKLRKFYYEPEYKGGGDGSETCITKH